MSTATAGPAPGFVKKPDYSLDVQPAPTAVSVKLGGALIARSNAALVMTEGGYPPRYYLPLEDINADCLARTDHSTFCPFKGTASYWTVSVGDQSVENGAWAYEAPFDECASIAGLVSFYGEKMSIEV